MGRAGTKTKIRNVVLVDDRADILSLFTAQFIRLTCTVRTALTAGAAVKTLAAGPADLVLIDVVLEGDCGFELVEQLRDSECRGILAMLTGQETDPTREKAARLGVEHVFFKPVLASAILAEIEDGIPARRVRPIALSEAPLQLVVKSHATRAIIEAKGNMTRAGTALGTTRQRLGRILERPLPPELRGLTVMDEEASASPPPTEATLTPVADGNVALRNAGIGTTGPTRS